MVIFCKMAIPFSLPSDDTTLEQYRSIHQLLLDLTNVLRALMVRNPEWIRPNNMPNVNNENVGPASPACGPSPAQQNAGAPPQFIFPLSPPNSAPNSPSPFFTATGSAFVLPDVIVNAAAATAPTNARPNGAPSSATFAPTVPVREPTASNAMPGASPLVLDAASVREKLLRKRKRAKLTKRKKLSTAACEVYEARRKVARTGGAACACATRGNSEMDAPMVDEEDDAESVVDSQDRIAPPPEYLRSCDHANNTSGCTFEHVCCLHHRHPSTSSTHPSADCHQVPVCMQVGEELRKIVECFRNPKELTENMSTDDRGFMGQFGRTMFTAALVLIGWKLLRTN